MSIRRLVVLPAVLPAGLVWRTVGAGWWVSRGWYTARPRLLAVIDEVDARRPGRTD